MEGAGGCGVTLFLLPPALMWPTFTIRERLGECRDAAEWGWVSDPKTAKPPAAPTLLRGRDTGKEVQVPLSPAAQSMLADLIVNCVCWEKTGEPGTETLLSAGSPNGEDAPLPSQGPSWEAAVGVTLERPFWP